MNNFLKGIFDYIAKKLGFRYEKKPEITDNYSDISDINITAAMANRLATIALLDSSISITGESERARYIDDFSQKMYRTRLKTACEVSLGTGDCIVKPNTDGKRIAVDIIPNESFVVTENIGDFIYGILIKCDEYKVDNAMYERIEYHRLRETEYNGNLLSVCYIYQMCFKDGQEVPITSVPIWADINVEENIPNADRLLFGRLRCPATNRSDVNSINGVPITYGLDVAIQSAKDAYHRFNQEYADKETIIFADKTLFTKDSQGTAVMPKGKNRIFQSVRNSNVDGAPLIHEYSPDIRSESLEKGIEVNFRMLELLTGLSAGVLTKPETNYATATEMKANLQMTFSFITGFRGVIEQCVTDLLYAVDKIANRNNITPMGTYDITFEWSDSYVENMMERFNQLVQSEAIGAIDTAEVRAWVMNEDYGNAKTRVEEIKSEEPPVVEEVV